MNRLLLLVIMCVVCSGVLYAMPDDERGISVSGDITAVNESYDGRVYLITKSNELIELDIDGKQTRKKISVPGKGKESYFCDLAIKGNNIILCSYDSQAIYVFNRNKLDKCKAIPVVDVKNPVRPMALSVNNSGNLFLQDADLRTFKVANSGSYIIMPDFTEVESYKGKGVIILPPEFKNDRIVYDGKVYSEDKKVIWQAPSFEEPYQLIGINFLGIDNLGRSIFLTKLTAGELDEKYVLYAVLNGEVEARREIPAPTSMNVLRYCRVTENGNIILILADPNNEDAIIIKKLDLSGMEEAAG